MFLPSSLLSLHFNKRTTQYGQCQYTAWTKNRTLPIYKGHKGPLHLEAGQGEAEGERRLMQGYDSTAVVYKEKETVKY